jgi:transposase
VRAEIVLLVECCFSKLKQFRRVASRYNQNARQLLLLRCSRSLRLWTGFSFPA